MSLIIQAKSKTLKSDVLKELRVFFPTVNFKVSSTQEEDRTVFTVSYTDGVSKTRVRSIVRQFAHTYYLHGKPIKVVFEIDRAMSLKTQHLLLNEMRSVWKVKGSLEMDDFFKPINGMVKDYIIKIFSMRDF